MPTNAVKTPKDEKLWSRAKAQAAEQGHSEDWAYVMSIYQNMKGKKKDKNAMTSKDLLKQTVVKEAGTGAEALGQVGQTLSGSALGAVLGGLAGNKLSGSEEGKDTNTAVGAFLGLLLGGSVPKTVGGVRAINEFDRAQTDEERDVLKNRATTDSLLSNLLIPGRPYKNSLTRELSRRSK